MISRVIADIIKEVSQNEDCLMSMYKVFDPFISEILHTIASKPIKVLT